MENTVMYWDVSKTDKTFQISHKVTIDDESETHIQTTYEESQYVKLLDECKLKVSERILLDDRIIYVCKKEL